MHRIRITPEAEIDQLEQVSELITRCAQKALEMENAPEHSFVDVTIVDNETIRTLNRENRDRCAVVPDAGILQRRVAGGCRHGARSGRRFAVFGRYDSQL